MSSAPAQAPEPLSDGAAELDDLRGVGGWEHSPDRRSRRFRRELLQLPDPDLWRPATGVALADAFDRLGSIDGDALAARLACTDGAARPWPPREPVLWRALSHPLSTQALERSGAQRYDAGRTAREARICARSVASLREALAAADPHDFSAAIERIGRVAGDGIGFRTSPVALHGDATGARLRFPPHRHIATQLAQLHDYLRRHLARDPLFAAAVAMIAITNLHPFLDANGRCSRILGNALLRIASPQALTYLPFYDVSWHCGHGWEIRVRIAELCADWTPVCAYLSDWVEVACAIAPRVMTRGES